MRDEGVECLFFVSYVCCFENSCVIIVGMSLNFEENHKLASLMLFQKNTTRSLVIIKLPFSCNLEEYCIDEVVFENNAVDFNLCL